MLGVEHVGEETSRFHGLCLCLSLLNALQLQECWRRWLSLSGRGWEGVQREQRRAVWPRGVPWAPYRVWSTSFQCHPLQLCCYNLFGGGLGRGSRSWLLRTILCQLGSSPSPGLRWAGCSSCQGSDCHRRAVEEVTPAS